MDEVGRESRAVDVTISETRIILLFFGCGVFFFLCSLAIEFFCGIEFCVSFFVRARIVWSADAKLGSIEFLRIMYVFYYASVTFYKIN